MRLAKLYVVLSFVATLVHSQGLEGRIIQAIRFTPADQPLTPADLATLPDLKVGQPYRPEDAASTIDRLFATGRYRDIQIDASATSNGLSFNILTDPQFFIGHLEIDGEPNRSPSEAELMEATRLRLGEPFRAEDLDEAERRLHRLLYNNGLFEHTIEIKTSDRADIQQRDVKFLIQPGPRAKYGEFQIEGDTKLSEGAIFSATGWRWKLIHLWRRVTQERTNKGIVGVQRKYQNKGWLMADVSASRLIYDPGTGRVHTTFRIDAGPTVELRATEAKVSQRVLKRYVPVFQEMAVDRDLLVSGAAALRDYFQSRGYFQAEVDFRQRQDDPDHTIIEYVISPGTRYKLVHVELRGHQFFSTDDLRERMFLLEAGLIRFRHGRYSSTFLSRDEEAIRNLYRSNGFRDVDVTSSVEDNYQGKPEDVAVVLTINEGALWLVNSLRIEGGEVIGAQQLRNQLSSLEQQPFSETSVARDRDFLLTRLQQLGYPDATFQWSATPDEENHQMAVLYQLTPGRHQLVRDVIVSGVEVTRRKLVDKRLKLGPGDPLSLVQLSSIQQQLYNLGVFSRIDMAIQNQTGATEAKHVLYDFHEASRYSLAVGFGAEFARIGGTTTDLTKPEGAAGLSPRVSVDLSRLNIWGLGHSVSLRGRISTLEQLGSINYIAPRFQSVEGRNVTFTTQYQSTRDVRTFSSRREEASIQISQQLSRSSNVLARFSYRRVSATSIAIPRLLIPQLVQPIRIGILSAIYVQDRRDDPTNARRGIYTTYDTGVASSLFGSQRSFLRILTRNATYYTIHKQFVLARMTSVGLIFPFRVPAGVGSDNAIPLPERFYGGGSSTHRGFPENQAGPRDIGTATDPATGFPLGGNALFFNTVEFRFPLLGENIGGVLFHDMGNIYQRINDISFRIRQRNQQDFNYMVHAAGFGVRYRTPVGPVRVDLAYSVNPPAYKGFQGTSADLLNCGSQETGITCTPVDRQTSHFQFFVSIGQSF